MNGFKWGIYPGPIVGAQSNGCPGQDGNWPILKFDELVGPYLQGAVHNADQTGGRPGLFGHEDRKPVLTRSGPPQRNAVASDGIYFEPCVTSLQIQMDYNLQRISPDRRASQYPSVDPAQRPTRQRSGLRSHRHRSPQYEGCRLPSQPWFRGDAVGGFAADQPQRGRALHTEGHPAGQAEMVHRLRRRHQYRVPPSEPDPVHPMTGHTRRAGASQRPTTRATRRLDP